MFSDNVSRVSGSASLGVTVTLDPGETVWLYVLLQTPAVNGSVIDASHTLITGWDNTADLTPAVTSLPVPEPTPLALFGLGLAALAVAKRRAAR